MAKCLSNGLNYPFYYVDAWEWVKSEEKENGGEYDLFCLLETEDREEAIAKANSVTISADLPEVTVYMDTGEDTVWVGTRDEYGWYDT